MICVVHVTWPTLNFYPPTLNFFLQILKLEENSRTKYFFCSVILFQLQNLEKKYISKWPSEMEILISMHSVFGLKQGYICKKRPFISVLSYFISKQVWIFQEKVLKKKLYPTYLPEYFSGCNLNHKYFLFGLIFYWQFWLVLVLCRWF